MGKQKHILTMVVILSIIGLVLLSRHKQSERKKAQQLRLTREWEEILDLNSLQRHSIKSLYISEPVSLRYPYRVDNVGQEEVLQGMMNVTNADAISAYRLVHTSTLAGFSSDRSLGTVESVLKVKSIRSKSVAKGIAAVPAKIQSSHTREADCLGRGRLLSNWISVNGRRYQDYGVPVPLILPNQPVTVGSQWKHRYPAEDLLDQDTPEFEARLLEFVKFDGVDAAKLEVVVDTYMMETLAIGLKPGTGSAEIPVVPVRQRMTYFVTIPEVVVLWVEVNAQFGEASRVTTRMEREADGDAFASDTDVN